MIKLYYRVGFAHGDIYLINYKVYFYVYGLFNIFAYNMRSLADAPVMIFYKNIPAPICSFIRITDAHVRTDSRTFAQVFICLMHACMRILIYIFNYQQQSMIYCNDMI